MHYKSLIGQWRAFYYSLCAIMVLVLITICYSNTMNNLPNTFVGRTFQHRQYVNHNGEFDQLPLTIWEFSTGKHKEISGMDQTRDNKKANNATSAASEAVHANESRESGKFARILEEEQGLSKIPEIPRTSKYPRYLFPLFQYIDGPSGLYIHIRYAIFAAIYQKRTLVIPYLHRHVTQTTGPKERTPNETFDMAKLRDIVSVSSSLDDFKRDCGTHFTLENITEGPYPEDTSVEFKLDEYAKIKRQCEHILGITMPYESDIRPLLKDVPERFKAMLTVQCLGYVTPRYQRFHNKEIEEKIGKSFYRAPYIRRMADEVMGKICEGSFAVMHWRNKSAEPCRAGFKGEACTESLKKSLALLSKQVDVIISLVWDTLHKHNISCLYVCTAPYEQKMVNHLKRSEHVHTLEDSFKISKKLSKYRDDNYVISLVEQEIAERTPLFISSGGSQWSRFVGYARERNHLKTIPLREIPGIPKHLLPIPYLIK
ncbi:uncharacterized protein [Ptychodera flava]|uniref:uncharacterized protein n=1 Tax=Ptychodera flava TaxID=63121 RepID=UPI003969DF5E